MGIKQLVRNLKLRAILSRITGIIFFQFVEQTAVQVRYSAKQIKIKVAGQISFAKVLLGPARTHRLVQAGEKYVLQHAPVVRIFIHKTGFGYTR